MKKFLAKKILYTAVLFFLPALVLLSWFNVTINNIHFDSVNYLLTFILPSVVFSYVVAYMTADLLDDAYHYTLPRVLFTLFGLVGLLILFSSWFHPLGYQSTFVTLMFHPVFGTNIQPPDPGEQAMRFYSLELAGSFVVLVILFTVASYIFTTKNVKPKKSVEKTSEAVKMKKVTRQKSGLNLQSRFKFFLQRF